MRISVTDEEGGLTFSLEVSEDSTLETLRALIEIESGIPVAQQLLFVDMKPINTAAETVAAAGIPDGCLILVARAPAPGAAVAPFGNAAARSSSSSSTSTTAAEGQSLLAGSRGNAGAREAAAARSGGQSSIGNRSHVPDMRSFFDFSNIVVKDGRATTTAVQSASRGGRRQQIRGGGAAAAAGGQQQQQGVMMHGTSHGVLGSSSTSSRAAAAAGGGGGAGGERVENSAAADEEYLQQQAETLVNVCAADASTMAVLVAENEALGAVLPEAVNESKTQPTSKTAFENLKSYLRKQLQERRRAEEARVHALNEALADPLSAKAQSFMMQQIQAQQVEDNYLLAQEHLPEAFGHVFMLYVPIEINGVAVKAFVDSGAQGTFMSESCAQKCNLTRLMDTRYHGTALGVGKAQILGRIHLATLKIGQRFYPSSFTVLQDEKIPFLLGLDLLRRYQCCIDLKKNVLRIDGDEVPFLGEKDIDKNAFGGERSAALEQGEAAEGAKTVDVNGMSSSSSSSSSSSLSATTTTTNPATTITTSTNTTINTTTTSDNASPSSQDQQTKDKKEATSSSPALESQPSTISLDPQDDAKVQQLVDLGFFRTDAVDALSQAEGNVEAAASFLLHEQQRIHRGAI